jgi:tRNA pseudouridine65 synthase
MVSILFEDADVLAVAKPAGLLTHRGEETSRREPALLQILRDLVGLRLYPAHRLDRATSGVVLFGKHPKAVSFLAEQFRNHQVEKCYLAIVRGWLSDEVMIETPLKDLDHPEGPLQSAETRVISQARATLPISLEGYAEARYSLLRVYPKTGRRHQIRRHLKSIHHPLIGDTVYGRGAHNRYFREQWECHRLLLHHVQCSWQDTQGKLQTAYAPLDEVWLRVQRGLGFDE